ncbi:DNA methyltransferase [Mycobacterium phage IronMan]|uniref:DNA methyltransferase n=1 Tax=Mycobacterium phage IronMan TaxID=2499042 RepID=A0A3S9UDA2_9CAUD|nr:DNA methyltransferase [Mycobacterium phage IronMan]AZS08285.1 DNA methyltransferase [Mycobacterium phage IronMan]
MPRLLDLFCGAGGAGMGYHRAGFEVVGVDIAQRDSYPFEFHQGDALEFLKEHGHEFDAIHASPPCQRYSALTTGTHSYRENTFPDLLPPTREALEATGKPYIIENVVGAPIREDLTLCGLMFGLRVFRHRHFEVSGFWAPKPEHPSHKGHRVAGWRHGVKYEGDMVAVYGHGGGKGSLAEWKDAMDIHWTNVRKEIAEAIPPAFTEYIGHALLPQLDRPLTSTRGEVQ